MADPCPLFLPGPLCRSVRCGAVEQAHTFPSSLAADPASEQANRVSATVAAWCALPEVRRASYIIGERGQAATLRRQGAASASDTAAGLYADAADIRDIAADVLEAVAGRRS